VAARSCPDGERGRRLSMDALILAAGHGTRLRPLTERTPKALIPVGRRTMLEHVVERLRAAGVDRLVINTHHLGAEIERFVAEHDGFGLEVAFSRETEAALETGGAIRHAAPLLDTAAPFFVHNVDILTDFPLAEMYAAHAGSDALATVAVMERETSRYLLFDDEGLCGHVDLRWPATTWARQPRGAVRRLAFGGVHVASGALPGLITETGTFPIFPVYLRLAGAGHRIAPFRIDGARWVDIGTPERLEAARRLFGGS